MSDHDSDCDRVTVSRGELISFDAITAGIGAAAISLG